MVRGDSHDRVIDQPFTDSAGKRLDTVPRPGVQGAADIHAVTVPADTTDITGISRGN